MTLFHAYIRRILENAKVRSYLERKHADILGVLQLSELTAQRSKAAMRMKATQPALK
jgi:hypothetical protein